MNHEPATAPEDKDHAESYKVKLGIRMFVAYSIFYASFVAINLISPLAMATIIFAGLNLATIYGFALIIVAFIEALVYDWLSLSQPPLTFQRSLCCSSGRKKQPSSTIKG